MKSDNLNLIHAPKHSPGLGSAAAEGPEKMSRCSVLTKAGMIMDTVKLSPITLHKAKCMGQREFTTVFHTLTYFSIVLLDKDNNGKPEVQGLHINMQ